MLSAHGGDSVERYLVLNRIVIPDAIPAALIWIDSNVVASNMNDPLPIDFVVKSPLHHINIPFGAV